MSAHSVNRLRQVEAPPLAPKPDERSGENETLRRLAAEPTAPGISRVVIAGVVRTIETALIAITGMAIYLLYVVRNVGAQPGYFAVTIGVAALSIVVFQSLHLFTIPAFRNPTRALARIAAGWALAFLVVF